MSSWRPLILCAGGIPIPPKYLANIQRLRSLNPGWSIQVWSDAGLRAAGRALATFVRQEQWRLSEMLARLPKFSFRGM